MDKYEQVLKAAKGKKLDISDGLVTALAGAMLSDSALSAQVVARMSQDNVPILKSMTLTVMAEEHQRRNSCPGRQDGTVYRSQDAQEQVALFFEAGKADPRNFRALLGLRIIASTFYRTCCYLISLDILEQAFAVFQFEPNDVLPAGMLVSEICNNYFQLGQVDKGLTTFEAYFGRFSTGPSVYDGIPTTLVSQYLLNLNLTSSRSRDFISNAHLEWGQAQRRALGPAHEIIAEDRDPSRRLKIGYMSADLYEHNVGMNLEALFKGHNQDNVHITVFQLNPKEDHRTTAMRELCDKWVPVHGLSNAKEVADQIRKEKVDILVETGGHTTANHDLVNNLDVLAMGLAPITVTYIGYPNTTGVDNCHYRIVDEITDPVESTQKYTEKLVRMKTCFFIVEKPHLSKVSVNPEPPCVAAGKVTFGSCNNVRKCSSATKRVWGRLMMALPDCELYLKDRVFSNEKEREQWISTFVEEAIDRSWPGVNFKTFAKVKRRIRTEAFTQTSEDAYAKYNAIDIALDSWPYAGTQTTCDAMLMGVPVMTMCVPGEQGCHSHNVGASLMTSCGLGDLVATSEEEFVEKAVKLAQDHQRLRDIRATLRQKALDVYGGGQAASERCANAIEAEYRKMWLQHLQETA